ncbi:hypothetical protein Ancab_028702 [Ancistrocladus abbreviatus]
MRIVYSFGISHELPGTFIVTYIRSSNPHHEYIGLYPKGFKFRKRMLENIHKLVFYFLKHINDPHHESQSIHSVAAMVLMQSPASGGSSGSEWGGSASDDGWRGSSDTNRSSTPASRTGRNDYGNGACGGHPSGVPRPYGGHGRGRGSQKRDRDGGNFDRQDSGYGSKWSLDKKNGHGPKWGSSANEDGDNSWGSFPGAKVQNSPGREAFLGGWGRSGDGSRWSLDKKDGYGSKWSLDKKDGYGLKWGSSANKDGDNSWGIFPGAKVQNSPGREAFPGGWGPIGDGSRWSLDKKDGYDSKWGSLANKDGDNSWGSFPGAKVQNSPGREALPSG